MSETPETPKKPKKPETPETPETPKLPPSPVEGALPAPPIESALPAPAGPAGLLPPNRFPAKPVHLPEPTYWPFFMGLGVAFIGWGLISFWLISIGGLVVFAIALRGWINILRHERQLNER